MKFLSIAVAFVSFCLITFHANPAFAAVIDAGAPPEDAVVVPLEVKESDDATGKLQDTELAKTKPNNKEKKEIDCCVLRIIFLCRFVLFCFVLFLPF